MKINKVLFEPWSLGDAFIAAAVLRECPSNFAIACNPKWHNLLNRAFYNDKIKPTLLSISLPYTVRDSKISFKFTDYLIKYNYISEVFSIRGDLRDFIIAHKIFPHARIVMKGWLSFLAWKTSLFDFVYANGWFPVKNRYKAWSEICNIPFEKIEKRYIEKHFKVPENGHIIIHIGAQWKSRQYPFIANLKMLLLKKGYKVILISGQNDLLPENIYESEIIRLMNERSY